MLINYIEKLNRLLKTGVSTEHSFRGDFQNILNEIINDKDIIVTNEPTRIVDVGAPDFSISRDGVPIGYIEAKDIDKDIRSKTFAKQFERYKSALDNLIITNYLDFDFFKNRKLIKSISIGKLENGKIIPIKENFEEFIDLIKDFSNHISRTITSPEKLAELMANKAKLLKDVLIKVLEDEDSTLQDQYMVFKRHLIKDMKKEEFADIYAQTITFGMFVARYHDNTLDSFSREEAKKLIPKAHPFLKGLFKYISDEDEVDERIIWIIDSLAEVFLATNLKAIFKDKQDPTIHFYETFLKYYNPNTRKVRGVWYTPKDVVNFIVRSVDLVLKDEFNLEGLIDESKIKIKVNDYNEGFTKSGKRKQKEIETHKVQILDPATGTGTFLATIVELIKKDFIGGWKDYVNESLIPRLNGFELLMASYAMAHLKLDVVLNTELEKRLNIYLTNSLEPPHKERYNLFSSYITEESIRADKIKEETPIMVILGNPPYSGHSANKNEFIDMLMEDYKKEYTGKKLKEKNPKWLNDDYVKFIRFAEYMIEKSGEGVVAFINPHGFLDNPTFRGMRYHLLKTFDKIYILNLHGNSRKKEKAPDGSKDENVFDIMQGVSINIFIKTTNSKNLAKVFYADLWGKREYKYQFLRENDIKSLKWQKLSLKEPQFYFVPRDTEIEEEYLKGFGVNKLFPLYSVGVVTARDKFTIDFSIDEIYKRIKDFINLEIEEARKKFNLGKDVRDWKIKYAKTDLLNSKVNIKKVVPIKYRPFDIRYTYYTGQSKGFHCMPRNEVMKHFINKENIGLITIRRSRSNGDWKEAFISKVIISGSTAISSLDINYFFPLYTYNNLSKQINFDTNILTNIEKSLGLKFGEEFNELELFDYIYAVLYHPTYREKYKEFLKIDFPRVPYPTEKEKFKRLAKFGEKLRKIHLLEDSSLKNRIIDIKGDNLEIKNRLNKKDIKVLKSKVEVQLNDTTTIIVPKVAWEFFIGGYQPAQKYLKDRVGLKLNRKILTHYNKIINALLETDKIMKEIDKIEI